MPALTTVAAVRDVGMTSAGVRDEDDDVDDVDGSGGKGDNDDDDDDDDDDEDEDDNGCNDDGDATTRAASASKAAKHTDSNWFDSTRDENTSVGHDSACASSTAPVSSANAFAAPTRHTSVAPKRGGGQGAVRRRA